MAVRCSKCGEELMGAVNRCWRCGQSFEVLAGPAGVPPVRRAPPAPPAARQTDSGAAAGGSAEEAGARDLLAGGGLAGQDGTAAVPVAVRRVGSPFAAGATGGPIAAEAGQPVVRANGGGPGGVLGGPYVLAARAPSYPAHTAAVGGAIGSVVLGGMSLVGCLITNAALVTALLGLAMGVWGLYSTRRGLAVLGLLLCFLALSIASFNGAVDLYEYMNGRSPFAPAPAFEEDGELLDESF